ncbi:amidase signature enzyme [Trematosphaeria pertusa]|uniref:Amidase signature enzyme n=1 Tax=Trematosphaeria pertusa TaxID=390896 RepID=A0A6A6IBH4_9PLEO|nr:amidase signature enzyme [Trematosphaeria pertusa]KAF2247756.1 amidase signature enzyme [Trematosphaeria pertusa]
MSSATSGNGYHIGTHRLFAGKSRPYLEDTNIPMVVRGPGIPAGATSKIPSTHIDFALTFLDIAAVAEADHPKLFDGRSLLGEWKNANSEAAAQCRSRDHPCRVLGPFRQRDHRRNIAGSYPQSLSIAVPSKLSAVPTPAFPLRGKRIGVKELFALRGLHMALSNRAFYAVASPAEHTAPAIQKLLDAGAILVGSTKCSSMTSREDPAETVDFMAPWNPRGDGYQSPVGSSSGSAAGVASYDWLDFTIGSDNGPPLSMAVLSTDFRTMPFLLKAFDHATKLLPVAVSFSSRNQCHVSKDVESYIFSIGAPSCGENWSQYVRLERPFPHDLGDLMWFSAAGKDDCH